MVNVCPEAGGRGADKAVGTREPQAAEGAESRRSEQVHQPPRAAVCLGHRLQDDPLSEFSLGESLRPVHIPSKSTLLVLLFSKHSKATIQARRDCRDNVRRNYLPGKAEAMQAR